jgi:hypothetical protein
MSDLCGTVDGMVTLKDSMSTEGETLRVYVLPYLLTPWSRVIFEKLIGLQLAKIFPAFYGTRRFLTALSSARHLSLS